MKRRTFFLIGFIVLLSAVVISSISISIALSDKMKATGDALTRLRQLMKGSDLGFEPLMAYIVPSDDSHQSEYIAPRDRRRQFISGFTGSAGTVVVTETEALLWTDGRYYHNKSVVLKQLRIFIFKFLNKLFYKIFRYYQQAEKQLDNSTWTLMKVTKKNFK